MDVVSKERIGQIDEYHKFLKDNDYIHRGYRLYFHTTSKILKSIFIFHNETVNIWTHLLGSLLFLGLLLFFTFSTDFSGSTSHYSSYIASLQQDFSKMHESLSISMNLLLSELSTHPLSTTLIDSYHKTLSEINSLMQSYEQQLDVPVHVVNRWPLLVYILSAITCLMCSTTFHLFSAHSHRVKVKLNSLDYAGIAILICGSYFPPIYYVFYCDELLIWFYLSIISLSSVFVFAVTFSANFQEPHCRWFRGVIFLMLGLFGVVPVGHIALLPDANEFSLAIGYYCLMGLFYILGVGIYIVRFPERYFRGKLDYIGNSHNIWHCMILIAAVFHYFGATESYYVRTQLKCS